MAAKPEMNGGSGIRKIARSYSAEALHVCAGIMRDEKADPYARAFASYAIVMAALSHPANERLEHNQP